jgi:hypothetical protein
VRVVQWLQSLRHVGFKLGPIDVLAWASLSRDAGWPIRAWCLLCIHRNWGIGVFQRVKKKEEDVSE